MASSFELKGPHFSIICVSSSDADSLETISHFWVKHLIIYQDCEDSINKYFGKINCAFVVSQVERSIDNSLPGFMISYDVGWVEERNPTYNFR